LFARHIDHSGTALFCQDVYQAAIYMKRHENAILFESRDFVADKRTVLHFWYQVHITDGPHTCSMAVTRHNGRLDPPHTSRLRAPMQQQQMYIQAHLSRDLSRWSPTFASTCPRPFQRSSTTASLHSRAWPPFHQPAFADSHPAYLTSHSI
jgi:hypothetical protein